MKRLFLTCLIGLFSISAFSQILVDKKEFLSYLDNAEKSEIRDIKIFDNLVHDEEEVNKYVLDSKISSGLVIKTDSEYIFSYDVAGTTLFAKLSNMEYEKGMLKRVLILVYQSQFDLFVRFLEEKGFTHYKVDMGNDQYPQIDIGSINEVMIKDNIIAYIGGMKYMYKTFIFEYADGE